MQGSKHYESKGFEGTREFIRYSMGSLPKKTAGAEKYENPPAR